MEFLTLATALAVILLLAFFRSSVWGWLLALAVFIPVVAIQYRISANAFQFVIVALALLIAILTIPMIRRALISGPLMRLFRRVLPQMSEAEEKLLESVPVGWEKELFRGNPDWNTLLETPLQSAEEGVALKQETQQFCLLLQSWQESNDTEDARREAEEWLLRIAGHLYMLDAAQKLASSAEGGVITPTVAAILAHQQAEHRRYSVGDISGVAGAGASFRLAAAHVNPYVMREIHVVDGVEDESFLRDFDKEFLVHVSFTLSNAVRVFVFGLTGSRGIPIHVAQPSRRYLQLLTRYSAAFSLIADATLISGGREWSRAGKLCTRMGDALGRMYLCCAAIKRFEDEHQPAEQQALLRWVVEDALVNIQNDLDRVLRNLPLRPLAWGLRLLIFPLGRHASPPSDHLTAEAIALLLPATVCQSQEAVPEEKPAQTV